MINMKTEAIKLTNIRTDAGTQSRFIINDDVVTEYAERMLEGDKFPPVVLFHDGSEYYLADGFHRVLAAQHNGFKDILAEVHKGGWLDALKYSLGANRANGLRRTNADKRHCVELALKEFGKMSDRAIADVCGVSYTFVSERRKELEQVTTVVTSQTRTGKDGKEYPAHKPEPAEPTLNPTVSTNGPATPPKETYSRGMQYAKMAISELKKIHPKDVELERALDAVVAYALQASNPKRPCYTRLFRAWRNAPEKDREKFAQYWRVELSEFLGKGT